MHNIDSNPVNYHNSSSMRVLPNCERLNISSQVFMQSHQNAQDAYKAYTKSTANFYNAPQLENIDYLKNNDLKFLPFPPRNANNEELLNNRNSLLKQHRKINKCLSDPNDSYNAELINKTNQQNQINQMYQLNNTSMMNGPNGTSRYKTELCRPFEESGECKYGDKCQFAHGVNEMRNLSRHPKYKTELCRTFHSIGFCPYGPRCHFIHNGEEMVSKIVPPFLSSLQSNLPKRFRHSIIPASNYYDLSHLGEDNNTNKTNNVNDNKRNFSLPLAIQPHDLEILKNTLMNAISLPSPRSDDLIIDENLANINLMNRRSLPTMSNIGNLNNYNQLPSQNINKQPNCETIIEYLSKDINRLGKTRADVNNKANVMKQSRLGISDNYKSMRYQAEDNFGSASDSGIEDNNLYANLFNTLLHKTLINGNISKLTDLVDKLNLKKSSNIKGASSPDSNFSGNTSETSNDHQEEITSTNSNSADIKNPRLPIFKSFSTNSN
ncbi:unnamed protein product [Gordionus sp. m RMFG-2023]|uniref:asparagine-rich protein-like n=1 Tax=Gordionus sp. m RMFG-2023 TaxID=3053472 RepID=UPI0030DEF160